MKTEKSEHIPQTDDSIAENEKNMIINGLREFTHGWCMDRDKTNKRGMPSFRCMECPFEDGTICTIKKFVGDRFGTEAALSISAMSR